MDRYTKYLDWIARQADVMADRVTRWGSVNSWSRNPVGLETLFDLMSEEFATLGGQARSVGLPPLQSVDSRGAVVEEPLGKVLHIVKRRDGPSRVLLVAHMDTVFPPDHPFQDVERSAGGLLRGPGVVDAKGGLAVMLTALAALERTPWSEDLGWEVLINPDEELGSPGSAALLSEAARRNQLGLVFEPAQAGGALVGARKGSGNFVVVIRGKSAHAGRDPEAGRNAVHALADFIVALKAIDGPGEGIRCNVGVVEGGGAVNVVPDLAIARFNVRVVSDADRTRFETHLDRLVTEIDGRDGIFVELHGGFFRPPKPLDARTRKLLEALVDCGRRMDLDLSWQTSGGVSDGNLLAAAGLPTADGLGPRGGGLHTDEEYLVLDSLPERAKLSARFLMALASGEIRFREE